MSCQYDTDGCSVYGSIRRIDKVGTFSAIFSSGNFIACLSAFLYILNVFLKEGENMFLGNRCFPFMVHPSD